jgi:cyclic beta-1,2-glucan synthetase
LPVSPSPSPASPTLLFGPGLVGGVLFPADRLEVSAGELARDHVPRGSPVPGDRAGWDHLRASGLSLLRSVDAIARESRAGQPVSPAAEWLVDNASLLREAVGELGEALPLRRYRALPCLHDGPFAGAPRVLATAWTWLEHVETRFDVVGFADYLVAYQRITPLTLAELWAAPSVLRAVLVENLRRLADRIVARRCARRAADDLADALLDPKRATGTALRLELWSHGRRRLEGAFLVQLVQRLRGTDPRAGPGGPWLDQQLARAGTTAEEAVFEEHRLQSAIPGPVRDGVNSLRTLGSVDWADFVERVSSVEATLRQVAGPRSDFDTRDRYRHVIEELARGADLSEPTVAARVADEATRTAQDPGELLLGAGRPALERSLGYQPPVPVRFARSLPRRPALAYASALGSATALVLAAPLCAAAAMGAGPLELLASGVLAAVPATAVATAVVHQLVCRTVPPHHLPRLELADGIPVALRTLLVVPVLLTDGDEVRALVGALEVHFLANDDGAVHFALLSDAGDADAEEVDGDAALFEAADRAVAALNARHGPAPGGPRFFHLRRHRRWNPAESRWMGWERKRGKLRELDRVLRGATDTTFEDGPARAALAALAVRYVFTVDADTRVPRGAVRRLVGVLAHPLHAPRHDDTGRVVKGYGLVQPRVTPTLPDRAERSVIRWMAAGITGIDPYAWAVSDVYQDLFGEGCFTGKGMYDVDAFERALGDRVPENAVLSHDLLEGLFVRAALVSDVEVFEDPPLDQQVVDARHHRWTRGDWQLLPWIFGRANLPAIGRFQMLDNLRRSLLAPTTLALLATSWWLPGARAWLWSAAAAGALVAPILGPALVELVPRRTGLHLRSALVVAGQDLGLAVARAALELVTLPERAWLAADAITRTGYRLAVSRRGLLAWVTAAHVQRAARDDLGAAYVRMAPGAGLAAAALVCAAALDGTLALAVPATLIWFGAPALLRAASRPWAVDRLDPAVARRFRDHGRRTWSWFEAHVTAADHHLPPDNTQEDPPATAHRTSPTNIGLYLLAATVARDLGWIGDVDLFRRLTATLATLDRLELHRGHLYNWYDTTTLAPLPPRYVSTVDSGNLAGHLVALRETCLELSAAPAPAPAREGLRDALRLLDEAARGFGTDRLESPFRRRQLEDAASELAAACDREGTPWTALARQAELVLDTARALAGGPSDARWTAVVDAAQVVRDTARSHALDESPPDPEAWQALARGFDRFARAMEFGFLYDPARRLFSLGYQREEQLLDRSTYDLLASEVRLASFVAVAFGQVPARHWFRLGRPVAPTRGAPALMSWSGSMFEYLMPELVMACPVGSLLETTNRAVVAQQIRHGRDRGVPWGISESAYNGRDLSLTYQYGPFGVAGLGLKHGLDDDLVVAPYATALAVMVDPEAADANLTRLVAAGAAGRYGFFDAVDYTRARLPDGSRSVVVRSHLAHHQAMTVVALGNALGGFAVRQRFHRAPEVRATELLLHERPPRHVRADVTSPDERPMRHSLDVVPSVLSEFRTPHTSIPATHRLSNGRYSVAVSAAGAGQSRWNDLAVTRWREDETQDAWGSFVYVAERTGEATHGVGRVWSAGHQPTGVEATTYEVSFQEHRVSLHRRDGSIATRLDVVVAPSGDGELRRLALTNHGMNTRTFEVTSYAELVLAPQAADVAHPAFSNLFVETSFDRGSQALLATRRARGAAERAVWAAHGSSVHGDADRGVQFETDRMRFLGRGRTARTALAVFGGHPLSNTVGPVLDPVFALRRTVTVAPGCTVSVLFVTLVGYDRDTLVAGCASLSAPDAFDRASAEAWTRARAELQHQGLEAQEALLYQRLGSRLTYPGPSLRASRQVLVRNTRGQASLWRFGISGDRPILLAHLVGSLEAELVRQLVSAVAYWRTRGLEVDLVLLDDEPHSYAQATLDGLLRTHDAGASRAALHVLKGERLGGEDRDLLFASARVVVVSTHGPLDEQVHRLLREPARPPARRVPIQVAGADDRPPTLRLTCWNGLGGFSPDGAEYVVILGTGQWTPLPWINVIANESFGFVVSESGGGYSWSGNSKENQLTPWANDPVSDPPGEVVYVRDDATGAVWTPTALPVREPGTYLVRHGQGYTTFRHDSHGIEAELVQYVLPDRPVKLSRLVLRNVGSTPRQLTVAAYVEWVLGPSRPVTTPFVVTSVDPATGALLATNPWLEERAGRVAFLDLAGRQTVRSGDRTEWVGRNGSLAAPDGMSSVAGRDRVGAGMDPCGVLQTTLTLAPGASETVVVALGEGVNAEDARRLVVETRSLGADAALRAAVEVWGRVLNTVQIRTPDRSMDLLVNRWLLYQVLSCRLWARTALSQAGGAYGFRDQLQDVMALCLARPELARAHVLRASAHQFVEGDVLHWWHPPSGRGVRTRFSDDRVWLPFVAEHYVRTTGDTRVLDELTPFLAGPPLPEGVDEDYREWPTSSRRPRCTSTRRARSTPASGWGPTGCRSSGRGTGTTA